MEITYLGHSCFKLKNKEGLTLLIDPFKSEFVGFPLAKELADVLVMSHQHEDHNAREMVTGPSNRLETFVIENEGEYEIGGVEIGAMRTNHDGSKGEERGVNLVTSIRMDDLSVLHLGDLGTLLTSSQREKIGSVDVLMIPVDGKVSLDMKDVLQMIKDLTPSLVIPMHFKVDGMKPEFSDFMTLEGFLDKVSFPKYGEVVHKIKIDGSILPDDTQLLIMNA